MDESKDLDLKAKRKEEVIKAQNAGAAADVDQLIEVDNLMLESLNKKIDVLKELN